MICLSEREVGFDRDTIGFPSLHGCHAIVYETKKGLFGFHSYGGSTKAQWEQRATTFNQFVREHRFGFGRGTRLYGACYPAIRGYSEPQRDNWKGELKAFCDALAFSVGLGGLRLLPGRIRALELREADDPPPVYIEFRREGDKCAVFVQMQSQVAETRGTNISGRDRRYVATRSGGVTTLEGRTGQVVQRVMATGLRRVHSSRFSFL